MNNNLLFLTISAIMEGNLARVRELLDAGAPINGKHGIIPLHCAIRYDREDIFRFLLDQGAKINVKDSNGYTPIKLAAVYGQQAMARLLLDRGANVNDNSGGYEIIIWAVLSGDAPTVQLLLERGANINATAIDSMSLIEIAIGNGYKSVVGVLLDKGVDVNTRRSYGAETILHQAVSSNKEGIVRLLLDRGADVNAKDITGLTPYQLAKTQSMRKVFEDVTNKKRAKAAVAGLALQPVSEIARGLKASEQQLPHGQVRMREMAPGYLPPGIPSTIASYIMPPTAAGIAAHRKNNPRASAEPAPPGANAAARGGRKPRRRSRRRV